MRRVFWLGVLLSGAATASFATSITNGTFDIAGTIFVMGSGRVTTPEPGTVPFLLLGAGMICLATFLRRMSNR